jgi:hypothetical protein
MQSLISRLQQIGFTHVAARDVCKIRKEDLPGPQMERLSRLEGLDEVEELDLLLSHYAIAWGHIQLGQNNLGPAFSMSLSSPRASTKP